jgi:adenine-specific DNA-methyltransferase
LPLSPFAGERLMRTRTSLPRARGLRKHATDAERALWQRLRNRQLGGRKFRRQHPIGPYIVDFACIETHLIVELDGGQHLDHAAADAQRTAYLNSEGYRVLRYWNDEVLLRIDDVLGDVLRELEEHPHPDPPPQAGEGDKERPRPSPPPQAGEGDKHRGLEAPLRQSGKENKAGS